MNGSLWKRRSVGPTAESYAELSLVPRSLETRTKRGFPHPHSDYGDGSRFGGKANPAKIAVPVGFLHRTDNPDDIVMTLATRIEMTLFRPFS
jgi:hypothetical protein